ncbi:MAG TPA: hypothetical protein VGE97_06805 [Nitrososphaera sp.]
MGPHDRVGNLLLIRRASEEVVESLLKRYAVEPKDETTDDVAVIAEEVKEEFTDEEYEEEDAGEIKPLEPLKSLQPL